MDSNVLISSFTAANISNIEGGFSEKPLVSIITVQYHNEEVTKQLLQSIVNINSYPSIEVIVVDNSARFEEDFGLSAIFPEVKLIRAPKNLGFAGGNNLGAKAASGDFYFFVNNDTEFTPGLIGCLLSTLQHETKAGIVSPKFHYYFNKGIVEYAGYEKVSVLTGRNKMIGCGEADLGQYNVPGITNYVHGGAMMLHHTTFMKTGGMPEIYFLYYEEFDWCESIKRLGFNVYYQPNALIYHKESMTTGKNSPLKTYYLTRNRILFMRRNRAWWQLGIFLCYFLAFTIPKNTFSFLINRDFIRLKNFWKGIGWHFNKNIVYN
jgi:GT2 family glycosyltransferase